MLLVFSLLLLLCRSCVEAAVPPNSVCMNATEIDATSNVVVAGDTTEAFVQQVPFGWCGGYVDGPGVWYKIKDNFKGKMTITLSSCLASSEYGPFISVLKGLDCDLVECVGGSFLSSEETCGYKTEYTFLASEHEPINYYILVSGVGNIGKFELNVHSNSSHFNVIDAASSWIVEVLNDFVWYEDIQSLSEKLNIQAVFGPELSVKSVRVQFDDQPSHCEKAKPYSVFGDKKGNYYGESMALGLHKVKATPYSKAGCKGTPGTPMVKDFEVLGCDLLGSIYDVRQDTIVDQIWGDYETPSLPCKVNVEAITFCGFEVNKVRMVMREKETNKIIHDYTEYQRPYFLFGRRKNHVNAGSISAGNYTVAVFINGIDHSDYAIDFNVGNKACT
jgi:hypothetical protein